MSPNCILLGISLILLFSYLLKSVNREGSTKFKRFSLDTDVMRKLGDGCCRFDGWRRGFRNQGYRTVQNCLQTCAADPKCWAAGYNSPYRGKWKCFHYRKNQEPKDLHLECDYRWKCSKKVVSGSAVCSFPNDEKNCPSLAKIRPKPRTKSLTTGGEIFTDQNKLEVSMIDQIKGGLKEIITNAKPPPVCGDNPNACRPGALTEDQFYDFLKTATELQSKTCDEPEPNDKCVAEPAPLCPGTEVKKKLDVLKKFTGSEIQTVLDRKCKVQKDQLKFDPKKGSTTAKLEERPKRGRGDATTLSRKGANFLAKKVGVNSRKAAGKWGGRDPKSAERAGSKAAGKLDQAAGKGPRSWSAKNPKGRKGFSVSKHSHNSKSGARKEGPKYGKAKGELSSGAQKSSLFG